jgi:hypothetical protein
MVSAARSPIGPHPATCSDGADAPENRKLKLHGLTAAQSATSSATVATLMYLHERTKGLAPSAGDKRGAG